MENIKIFKFLQEQIHTTIIATNDEKGKPVTCAIDIMDYDENGLYFLTAKGKNFYKRLKSNGYLSLTGIKGENTMSCVAVSVHGNVREIGAERLQNCLIKIHICTKYIQQSNLALHLQCFVCIKVVEIGLTFLKNLLNVFVFLLVEM